MLALSGAARGSGPAAEEAALLTASGRSNGSELQGRDEERAFQAEQGTWFRQEGKRGLAGEASSIRHKFRQEGSGRNDPHSAKLAESQ